MYVEHPTLLMYVGWAHLFSFLCSKRQQTFSVKDKKVNILVFVGHKVCHVLAMEKAGHRLDLAEPCSVAFHQII